MVDDGSETSDGPLQKGRVSVLVRMFVGSTVLCVVGCCGSREIL